ncbi:lipopolysaccharide heptosyltransferase II [PVC group bacterium]|nr:lipopolysaccharide heptosyltransferase II [PVC group bacterium]
MKTLIIKYSSLGDVIQATPLAKIIKERNGGETVSWLVEPQYEVFLKGNPSIDKIFLLRKPKKQPPILWLKNFIHLIRQLRGERFDRVIDAQGLFLSGLIAFLSRAKERVGFSNAREGAPKFYTRKVDVSARPINAAKRYGLLVSDAAPDKLPFYIPRQNNWEGLEKKLLMEGCQKGKDIILLCPTSRWVTKNWPIQSFIELAHRIVALVSHKVIFVGAPEDQHIQHLLDDGMGKKTVNFLGSKALKMEELITLVAKSRLFVTNDSGPMHLAAALGTPIVALFGPTSDELTGPNTDQCRIVKTDVDCRPCFKKVCPIQTHDCMKKLSVDDVFKACEIFLNN